MTAAVPRLTDARLAAMTGVRHGFFTRVGGVSKGIYASLNCGVGSHDDRAQVIENRTRVAASLGAAPERLATPYQVHGADAVVVTEPWETGRGPHADALVTDRPGIAVGIGAADCAPVLFADAEAGVVGAAHAGWKGALAGVLEATVAAMERLGARRERIVAALGPTIARPSYEVGADFAERFLAADADNARFFASGPRAGHLQFDLPGFILDRLSRADVMAAGLGLDTYAGEDRFFSFRRATHRGEPDYGRQLSAIVLVE